MGKDKRFISISFKFGSIIVAMVLVVSIVFSVLLIHHQKRILVESKHKEITSLVKLLATSSTNAFANNDFDFFSQVVDDMSREPNIAYVMFMDERGEILLHSDETYEGRILQDRISKIAALANNPNKPVVQTYTNKDMSYAILDVTLPIVAGGNKWGSIRVGYSLESLMAKIKGMYQKMILYCLILVIIAIVVSLYLSNLITKPIKHLSQVAQSVAQGDMGARAHVKSNDEIRLFSDIFNDMTRKLKEVQERLKERIHRADEELAKRNGQLQSSYNELQKTNRELTTIFELGKDITSIMDVDRILSHVASLAQSIVRFRNFAIWMVDELANRIKVKFASRRRGVPEEGFDIDTKVYNPFSWIAKNGFPINFQDTTKEQGYIKWLDETKSDLAIPLMVKGKVMGIFEVESNEPNAFSEEDQRLLSILVSQAAIAIENARLLKKTEKLAVSDGLTGLSNHRHFQERLEFEIKRTKRTGRPLSVLMGDIDGFKVINDTYGHQVGDMVLKTVASILQSGSRETDMVARYGGEEFGLILPNTGIEDAFKLAERLRESIEGYDFSIELETLKDERIMMSFGVACTKGRSASREKILKEADIALYNAKKSGKNRVCRFDHG